MTERRRVAGSRPEALEQELQRLRRELAQTNAGVLAMVAELDDAVRQWQVTFDAIEDGVCLVDAEGRIMRANAAFGRAVAISPESLPNRALGRVLNRAFGVGTWSRLRRAGANGRLLSLQLADRWYELRRQGVERVPNREGDWVLVVADVTERKRLAEEERLRAQHQQEAVTMRRQAERMAQLEKVKTEFLKLASHELRAPVALLQGYLSMIADGSLGEVPEPMGRVLPVLTAKAQEMNLMIEQLLETARLEDSRLVLDRGRHDLRAVAESAAEMVRPLVPASHRLELDLGPSEVAVEADAGRVTTILTNLIDNAVKYSPEGGSVLIRVEAAGDSALATVSDEGLGIAPEDMPRLFSRFGRLVTSDNSHINGTGLGLYLARELARMHGGDITCVSAPGAGSTFELRLPAAG